MKAVLSIVVATFLAACNSQAGRDGPPEPAATRIAFDKASSNPIEHGRRLGTVLGCNGCHGSDLTGEDWSDPDWGRLWTANLTRTAEVASDQQLIQAITQGRRHDGTDLWDMPSHLFTHLGEDELEAIIAWLRSVPPTGDVRPGPTFDGPKSVEEIAAGTMRSSAAQVREEGRSWPPDAAGQHALGRYVVRATCAECHRLDLQGDRRPDQDRPAPPLNIVSAYDLDQFRRLLRQGTPLDGREMRLMGEVARWRYAHLTDREVQAVYAYLKAVAETP